MTAVEVVEKLKARQTDVEDILKAIEFSPLEVACVQALLSFSKHYDQKQFYVGGVEGSSCALEVHIGVSDSDGLDVLVSFLLPEEDVNCVKTVRHTDALNLIASFWRVYKSSPVLIQMEDNSFGFVLCGLQTAEDSYKPFTLEQFTYINTKVDPTNLMAFAKPEIQTKNPGLSISE